MTVENEDFEVSHIEWRYQESREKTGDRNPRKPIRVGVNSLTVKCKKCGSKWTAVRGRRNGNLTEMVGFVRISCQGCGTKGEIANQTFNQL